MLAHFVRSISCGLINMIVAMKKVTVFVQDKDADAAVGKLRSLGLLHVLHEKLPSGEELGRLRDDLALTNQVIGILSETEFFHKQTAPAKEFGEWKMTARHILGLRAKYSQLKDYSLGIKAAIALWQEWGDFDPAEIKNLMKKNIYIRFYQIPVKELKNLPAGVILKKVSLKAGLVNCAVITSGNLEIPFKELGLPKMSLARMRERLSEDNLAQEAVKKDLQKHAGYLERFLARKRLLEKELELRQAIGGMGGQEGIRYLTGFTPIDAQNLLLAEAKKEKWGILISQPQDEDAVPTLIRSPRWISVIEPVFKLLEIVPGYHELDISPVFLSALSLFFGMIIGDAGYGAAYMLITFLLQRKFAAKIKDKRLFPLIYLFSACAIFWGLLTGTVFGQEWYLKAGFKPLIPVLNDTKFLQAFCFFLGALHLTIGHGWQVLRKLPSLSAFADLGWISVLWAAFFLARTLILDEPFPLFGKWLIIIGLGLVILCTSPQKNILKMLGHGLGTVALSLMNNFTDVVSYIRLFAVGLAGVAISDAVNMLAAGFKSSNILAFVFITFLGHGINIILGPMSVLVHGIRLNVLEFSSHAGLSWSGVAYKPLKE